jgi:hypothetical protein
MTERVLVTGGGESMPPTAHDRCDRCNAAAQVRVLLNTGGVLFFCGHHGRMHQSALITVGKIVGDLW